MRRIALLGLLLVVVVLLSGCAVTHSLRIEATAPWSQPGDGRLAAVYELRSR